MTNDTRETLPVNGSFYEMVMDLFLKKQKAGILYEDNGVTRANGMITAVFDKNEKKWMRFDSGLEVQIDTLYAVNGIFSSDYSEC
jgi:hypothetical protein